MGFVSGFFIRDGACALGPVYNQGIIPARKGTTGGADYDKEIKTSSIGHSRASQVPTKLIQKGLDFGWEQSVTVPASQSAKGSSGILPRRLSLQCGLRW